VLIIGFLAGLRYDTSFLKPYILYGTVAMVFPSMVGFRLGEVFEVSSSRVLILALVINFIFVPVWAYLLGNAFLLETPELFAGLAIMALIPTSGMTISWTMIFKGNVPSAINLTVVGLLLGSLIAPWYLLAMVGQYVPVDVVKTMKVIGTVVAVPMVLGIGTYRLLLWRYSREYFEEHIKPLKPAFSVWALIFVIFTSISLKARMIVQRPEVIVGALAALLLFYLGIFAVSTFVGRRSLPIADNVALVYGTSMRHLSISLGLSVAAFGPGTALVVALAFLIQQQGAVWYGRLVF
jgi:ACR3 family arsenite efflux pump ArsB